MALPVCPAVRQCFAIGTYQTASAFTFLIEHLSGGEWQPLTAPLPAGASSTGASQPGGIACPSQGWCVAVGGYIAGSEWEGVIDTYSKGAWHSSRAPLPAGTTITSAKLTSVACAAAGSCAATGLLLGSAGNTGFLETLSNGRWSAEVMPTPQPSLGGVANAIACPAVGSCETVGSYATNDTTSFPVADVLSDGTWSEVALPLPADDISGSVVEFSAMSCPAAGSCVAVGVYHPGTLEQAVVETLAGGTWSAVRAPTPTVATGMSVLNGVACTGLASCTAIGQYRTGSSSFGMVDTLTGGTWSSIAAPLPAGGTTAYSNLTALSCVPPDACVAVGDYVTPTTAPAETQVQGLIDSEDSGPWVGLQAPEPANDMSGPQLAALSGVSCPVATYCVAVGGYGSLTGDPHELELLSTPHLVLTPSRTAPAATVSARISGFDAAQKVELRWRSSAGSLLATVTTDSSGSGVVSFTVPKVAAGEYLVLAEGAGGPSAAVSLAVN